ncbi:MAG TPA: hypothetical protein VE911_10320 [Candidatus Nitrosopolaris sp.]|nr:hypothetical protein [Candidatus Nitrosopolaris sp.]
MKQFLVAFGIASLLVLAGAAPASARFGVVAGGTGFVAGAPFGGFVGAPVVAPGPVFFPPAVPYGYWPPYYYYPHYRFGWHDSWYEGPYFGGRSERIYGFTIPAGGH